MAFLFYWLGSVYGHFSTPQSVSGSIVKAINGKPPDDVYQAFRPLAIDRGAHGRDQVTAALEFWCCKLQLARFGKRAHNLLHRVAC